MKTATIENLKRQSLRVRGFLTLLLIAMPLLVLVSVADAVRSGCPVVDSPACIGGPLSVNPAAVAGVTLFQHLPTVALAGILLLLRDILGVAARGVIFTRENADRLARMGRWTLALAVLNVLVSLGSGPLIGHVTNSEPVFEVNIDFTEILGAVLLFLLAHVMLLAASLQDEADLTV